jgi:hypothetical protein
VQSDLEHSTHVLQALQTLEHTDSAVLLRSALSDELDLLRRRVLAGLSIRYGAEEISRIEYQLAQRSTRFHALALEWLAVTLVGTDRAAVALLEPDLSTQERLRLLARWFLIPQLTPQTILLELAEDRDGRWRRPWITACALVAAADMPEPGLEVLARAAVSESAIAEMDDPKWIVRETLTAIRQRQAVQQA